MEGIKLILEGSKTLDEHDMKRYEYDANSEKEERQHEDKTALEREKLNKPTPKAPSSSSPRK
jgi:hypothetical protein